MTIPSLFLAIADFGSHFSMYDANYGLKEIWLLFLASWATKQSNDKNSSPSIKCEIAY